MKPKINLISKPQLPAAMTVFLFLNLLYFLILLPVQANTRTTLNRDMAKATMFVYPSGIANETEVPFCPTLQTPCNFIQNPFFFPFKVHRLCKCPNQVVCPFDYELKRKFDTVFLNNREQIKFCAELPRCMGTDQPVLNIGRNGYPIELNCFCPRRRYWQKMSSDDNENADNVKRAIRRQTQFKCEKIKSCETICGHVREDTYASYFQCSCPTGELCMPYKTIGLFEEVSYKGSGYVSKCGIP